MKCIYIKKDTNFTTMKIKHQLSVFTLPFTQSAFIRSSKVRQGNTQRYIIYIWNVMKMNIFN